MRRSLLLLPLLLMTAAAASAQTPFFQCVATTAVPPTVPASKLDGLVGDLVLDCTGGTPIASGLPLPQFDLKVSLNTNLTSRVDGSDNSEALLLIDEPGSPASPVTQQTFCAAPGPCPILGVGAGSNPYVGRPNVFQGRRAGVNAVLFAGVPIAPPDFPGGHRVVRITNLRADASALPVSANPPAQILMLVSIAGSPSFPVASPVQTAANAAPGLAFSVHRSDGAPASGIGFSQDASHNAALATNAGQSGCVDFRLRYAESFPTAFLIRNIAGGGASAPVAQNMPGLIYNTETGFYNPLFPTLGGAALGLADHGTRLIAYFNGVPAGVRLYVSTAAVSSSGGLAAQLITAAADGSGAFLPVAGTGSIGAACPDITSGSLAEVALTNGSGFAVWEVTTASALASGSLDFGVVPAWTTNPGAGLPARGTSTVNGNYAPVSTVATASATAPDPRFADVSSARNLLTIAAAASIPAASGYALLGLALMLGTLGARALRRR